MADEKKPTEEEQKPTEEKQDEPKPTEEKNEEPKPEETTKDGEQSGESKPEKEPEEQPEETAEQTAPPELSETDKLKEENFRLKTQLEAMKIGFNPDCLEDAVVLAENIVKRGGSDISTALQAVAKKYPDWKTDSKSKGGFKVGADSSKQKQVSDEKLNRAFGIKK